MAQNLQAPSAKRQYSQNPRTQKENQRKGVRDSYQIAYENMKKATNAHLKRKIDKLKVDNPEFEEGNASKRQKLEQQWHETLTAARIAEGKHHVLLPKNRAHAAQLGLPAVLVVEELAKNADDSDTDWCSSGDEDDLSDVEMQEVLKINEKTENPVRKYTPRELRSLAVTAKNNEKSRIAAAAWRSIRARWIEALQSFEKKIRQLEIASTKRFKYAGKTYVLIGSGSLFKMLPKRAQE
ncbi:hypothetical protein LTR28_012431, partial [Elasticomyces elasticus]